MRLPAFLLLLCLPLLALLARADELAAEAERAGLAHQRDAIEARFTQDSQACEQRFVVTACLDQARERREQGLRPLQRRLEALALAERQARAAAQREAVARRQREFTSQEGQRRTEALRAPAPAASESARELRTPRNASQDRRAHEDAKAAELARAQREAARRVEQAQARQRQLQQRQEEQLKEQLKKRGDKPAATRLPVPTPAELAAAASAAGRR